MADINEINKKVKESSFVVQQAVDEIGRVVVGQKSFIESLVLGVLTGGHILVEGPPGLAKTLSVSTLSKILDVRFQKIQFTPDLLPADIVGTVIYNAQKSEFSVKKGPIFSNIVLADEINRSPAKVQSALLEAMQERQVTIGHSTFEMEDVFIVLATQNPIEHEGTYPLPEAQMDRFMMKLLLDYPNEIEEKEILNRMSGDEVPQVKVMMEMEKILKFRKIIDTIYMDEKIKDYIIKIVFATRTPEKYGLESIKDYISYGCSPRATINLVRAAKAHSFLRGRGYVVPEDIKQIAYSVLRHRIVPSFEAEADNITSDHIIKTIFDEIEVP